MVFTQILQAIPFLVTGLAVALVTGCSAAHPTLHESFGVSVSDLNHAQTANPRASENLTPVAHMHGPAADQAVDKYVKSFEPNAQQKSQAAQMFVGLGAAGGGAE